MTRGLCCRNSVGWHLEAKADKREFCSLEFLSRKNRETSWATELQDSPNSKFSVLLSPREPWLLWHHRLTIFVIMLENTSTLIICHSNSIRVWISPTSFMIGSLTGKVFSTRAWETSWVQKMDETQITTWPGHCKTHWLRGTWESAVGHITGQFVLGDSRWLPKNLPKNAPNKTKIHP